VRSPRLQASDLSVQLIQVSDGRLALSRLGGPVKPQALEGMTAEIRNFAPTASFPFSMTGKLASGGDIHVEGKAGPLNSADAAAPPVEVTLKLINMQMAASGLMDPASGIDGQLSIDGTGTSDGTDLRWTGRVHIEKLKLSKAGTPAARPVDLDVALDHNVRTHAGVLSRGDIHLGSALAHLTGNYAEQGGTATVSGTISGPVTASIADSTIDLNNAKVTGFDLGSKLSPTEKLAGIKAGPDTMIQTLHAKIHAAPGGETVQDLRLALPAVGELDGAGTVSANHALDFKMRATVHTIGALLATLGQRGGTIPFFIQGTSENPSFQPDMKGMAADEVKRLESGSGVKSAVGLLGGLFGRGKKQ
jgi:AsmA protein